MGSALKAGAIGPPLPDRADEPLHLVELRLVPADYLAGGRLLTRSVWRDPAVWPGVLIATAKLLLWMVAGYTVVTAVQAYGRYRQFEAVPTEFLRKQALLAVPALLGVALLFLGFRCLRLLAAQRRALGQIMEGRDSPTSLTLGWNSSRIAFLHETGVRNQPIGGLYGWDEDDTILVLYIKPEALVPVPLAQLAAREAENLRQMLVAAGVHKGWRVPSDTSAHRETFS